MINALRRIFDGSCIKRRFFVSVWAIIFSTVGQELGLFAKVAIGGFFLGSDVLSSFGMIVPVVSVQFAVLRLFIDGLIILMPRAYGKGNRALADRLLGSAIVAEALAVLVVGVLTYACRGVVLDLVSVGFARSAYVETFYDWSFPITLFICLRQLFERLVISEGRLRLVYLGTAVFVGLDILGLVTLVRPFGISGICAAESFSALAATIVIAVGLALRKTSFRIRLALAWTDVRDLARTGLPKVFGRLGDAIVVYLLNAFILRHFGTDWLACVHFVKSSRKFLTAFPDAFENASMPIVCSQIGARNWRGVVNTMRLALIATPLTGLVATFVTVAFARTFAGWCGFQDANLDTAIFSLRWGTVMITAFFIKDIFCSYYAARGRVVLPSVVRFLSRGLLTFALGACCVMWLGGDGEMFMRLVAVSDFCLLAFLLAGGALGRKASESLVLNLPHEEYACQAIFDIDLEPESIVSLRERVARWLAQRGCSSRGVMRARLLVEETLTELLLRTNGRRHLAECVVSLPADKSGGTMQFGDTLSLMDHTDPDAVPQNQADALSRMVLASYAGPRDYNPVIGSNRTIYSLTPFGG